MLYPVALLALALAQTPYARPAVRFSPTLPFTETTTPRVAAEGGRAVAVWHRAEGIHGPGYGNVVAAVSRDAGRTWSAAMPLHSPGVGHYYELDEDCVDVAGGYNRVVFRRGLHAPKEAWFRVWPAGVAPAGPLRQLSTGHAPGTVTVEAARLAVSADGQQVAVLLHVEPAPGTSELVLHRSVDGGATFLPRVLVHAGGPVGDVELGFDGAPLHVVWQEDLGGFGLYELRYQRSADGGQTWLPVPAQLAFGQPADPYGFDLDVDGSRVAVAYSEVSALCGVSVDLSSDGGLTWSGPARVGNSLSPACVDRAPRVFHALQDVVVAWSDDRQGFVSPWVAWSNDAGFSWTEKALSTGGSAVQLAGDPATGVFATTWATGAVVEASWSRSIDPLPTAAFPLDFMLGNTIVSEPALAYDPVYGDFLCVWRLLNTLNQESEIRVAGFRNAQVETIGPLSPGSQAAFLCFGFPEVEAGAVLQVLVSFGSGGAALADGRRIGLMPGPALAYSAGNPAFQATLVAGGGGATGPIVVPPTLPPGTAIHFTAVAASGIPPILGSLTDPRVVTVQ